MQFFGRLGQIGEIPNVAPHSLLLYRRLGCVPRYLGTLPCATLFFANNSNDEEGRCHGRTSVCVIHTNYGGYIKLAVQWSFSHAYDIQGNSTGATIEFDHVDTSSMYIGMHAVCMVVCMYPCEEFLLLLFVCPWMARTVGWNERWAGHPPRERANSVHSPRRTLVSFFHSCPRITRRGSVEGEILVEGSSGSSSESTF